MNAHVLLATTGSEDTPAGLGFVVLAAIVSFNTLLYVVLTVAKLIPWPRQPLPAEVRRGVTRIGLTIDEESVMSEIPLPRPPESDDPAEDRRLAAVCQEVPQAFLLTGGLVMAFAVAVGVSRFSLDFRVHVLEFIVGVVLLITGVVLGYSNLTGRTMSWVWALTSTVLVVLLVREGFEFDALTPRAYAVILMTAYMPITLSWRPAILAGAGMSAGTALVTVANLANGGAMLLLAPSALLVSGACQVFCVSSSDLGWFTGSG